MIEVSKRQTAAAAAQTAMKARLAELGFDPVQHEALVRHIVGNVVQEFFSCLALDRLQPIEQKVATGVADIPFLTPQLAGQIGDAYRDHYPNVDSAVDVLLDGSGINCEAFEELLERAIAPLGAQAIMGALAEQSKELG